MEHIEQEPLDRAWRVASAALPNGWRLDGITCTSRSLAPEDRSDRWRAIAVRDDGTQATAEADTPGEALSALVRELSLQGS